MNRPLLGTLLLVAWLSQGAPWAAAKPPDLPLDPSDMVGTAASSKVGPALGPILLTIHPLLPTALVPDAAPVRLPSADAARGEFLCPYLRPKCAGAVQVSPDPAASTPDVLENLQRLEQAEDLLAIARVLGREGRPWEVRTCCEVVSRLAPGSRLDEQARLMMAKVQASGPGSTPSGDCAEEQDREFAQAGKPAPELPREPVIRWVMPSGELELGLQSPGLDIRLGCDLRCGGHVYHLLFSQGGCTAWTSADTSAAEPGRRP